MRTWKKLMTVVGVITLGVIIAFAVIQQGRYSNQTYNQNFETLDTEWSR